MAEPVTPAAVAPTPTDAPAAVTPAADAVASQAKPVDAAPAKEAQKPELNKEQKAEIRRLKLKLDGKDMDLTEDEVVKLAQKGTAADKRFQEAAQLRKQAEDVLEFIKANPKEALSKLGIDLRKFSEDTLVDILKREAESPEQKRIREAEDKLKHYEKVEADRKAAADKAEEERKANEERDAMGKKEREIMEHYDRLFVAALDKVNLPKNAYTVKRMAELQRVNLKNNLELSPESLAKVVQEDYDSEFNHRTNGFDGDKLIEMLGPDRVKLITKAQIAKLKGKPQKFSQTVEQPKETTEEPKMSWREFTRKSRYSRT